METTSKNKRGRGRPVVLGAEDYAIIPNPPKTKRQQQNRWFAGYAAQALAEKGLGGLVRQLNVTILAALGRAQQDAWICDAAQKIVAGKYTTRNAVEHLRQNLRENRRRFKGLDGEPECDAWKLTNAFRRLIKLWKLRHPSLDDDDFEFSFTVALTGKPPRIRPKK